MKKYIPIIIASTFALGACANAQTTNAQTAKPTQSQSVQDVKPKAKGVWIDVRTADEFNAGHLKGSLNIPVDKIASQIASVEPNKNAPINLYCRSGRRAETARQTLIGMGYTNVVNHGGYEDLIKQGYR